MNRLYTNVSHNGLILCWYIKIIIHTYYWFISIIIYNIFNSVDGSLDNPHIIIKGILFTH